MHNRVSLIYEEECNFYAIYYICIHVFICIIPRIYLFMQSVQYTIYVYMYICIYIYTHTIEYHSAIKIECSLVICNNMAEPGEH